MYVYVCILYIWLYMYIYLHILNDKIWTSFHVDMSFFGRLVISFELTDQTSQWQLFDAMVVLPKSQSRNHLNHFFKVLHSFQLPCPYLHPPEVEQRVYPWIWQVGLEDDRFAFLLGFGNKLSGATVGCSTSGFGVPEFYPFSDFGQKSPVSRSFSRLRWLDRVRRGAFARRSPPWQMNVTSWRFFSASPCHWKSGKPYWVL